MPTLSKLNYYYYYYHEHDDKGINFFLYAIHMKQLERYDYAQEVFPTFSNSLKGVSAKVF